MNVLVRIIVGVLLVAHGLLHLLWFAPSAEPTWPFRIDRSWAVPEAARRPVAIVLVTVVVVGFALVGLAIWGVPMLAAILPGLAVGSALASLAMLLVFFDRQLLLGVAIDVLVIVVALWQPSWTEGPG